MLSLSALQEVTRNFVMPRSRANDENSYFDLEVYEKLFNLGVFTPTTPKRFGGQEMNLSDLIHIARELGYTSGGVTGTFVGSLLGYCAVVDFAPEALKQRLCIQYPKNFSLWSFAMTEKGCGSDLSKIITTARRVEGGYILNGEKNFITNANFSSHISLFANALNAEGKNLGMTCFYIEGNTPGLTRGEAIKKMGWRESNTGHLLLNNVFVPDEHVLGTVGGGFKILAHSLTRSKTLLAASSVGLACRCMDLVIQRLRETERFDKALLEQPAIRHKLARIHTQIEAAWLLVQAAAKARDEGKPATKESSMAKLFAGSVGAETASEACEFFGARGFFAEHEVSRLYRDSKAVEIIEGPSLVQELIIAKHILSPEKKTELIQFSHARPSEFAT